jgi:DNA-binding transcriptional regulator LsrR (DeoR family)
MSRKTALTFDERITAAYLHYVQGVEQHVIAMAMGVNMGRVNEACLAIKRAIKHGEPAPLHNIKSAAE